MSEDRIQGRIEGAIADGIARGEFDNLPGAGKPLDLGDPNDPDWWIKKFAEREKLDMAEALPPTAKLRKESLEFYDHVGQFASIAEVREAVRDVNERIEADRRAGVKRVETFPLAAPDVDEARAIHAWYSAQKQAAKTSDEPAVDATTVEESVPRRTSWWRRLFS